MANDKTRIEIIDFKKFSKPHTLGVVGIAFGKIVHGLTTNFFSTEVFQSDLDNDGYPIIPIQRAVSAIRYSVSSHILLALYFLQENGWFDPKVKFWIDGAEPHDEVRLEGWSDTWNTSAQVDLAYYLEDVCEELEVSERAFSQEWFHAKVSHLYFIDIDVPDVALTVGILLAQMWWKFELEEAALRGNANAASLERANTARQQQSKTQNEAKMSVIASYWAEAEKELGSEVMRRDSNAAQAIYTIALKRQPRELQLKSTGEIIGPEAIRKRLLALRKLEKIG
ncbi:MAG: hypothetical protein CMM42_08255 [Rhodospirillaceae bacterium]|nr:hypothetical protein [Rhodospirillaceae bacterium]